MQRVGFLFAGNQSVWRWVFSGSFLNQRLIALFDGGLPVFRGAQSDQSEYLDFDFSLFRIAPNCLSFTVLQIVVEMQRLAKLLFRLPSTLRY